jgi:hypothetical protein
VSNVCGGISKKNGRTRDLFGLNNRFSGIQESVKLDMLQPRSVSKRTSPIIFIETQFVPVSEH